MRKLSATPVGPVCSTITRNPAAIHLNRISPPFIAPAPPNLLLPLAAPRRTPFTASTGISAATVKSRSREWVGTNCSPDSCAAANATPSRSPKPKIGDQSRAELRLCRLRVTVGLREAPGEGPR